MADAIDPDGVGYIVVQPQGAVQPIVPDHIVQQQSTSYQTGMWPMWRNIGQKSDAY